MPRAIFEFSIYFMIDSGLTGSGTRLRKVREALLTSVFRSMPYTLGQTTI